MPLFHIILVVVRLEFACGEFVAVVDEVPTTNNAHTIGIIFLCTVVDDYPGIGHSTVGLNLGNLLQGEDAHCMLCPFC